ncbi:ATP-binding protein [Kordiimonas sp.]|uniref:ATP-binding protein n=1 Tax=Kordiimonas sp. TaxID=1970157 RepID=UPI003A8F3025
MTIKYKKRIFSVCAAFLVVGLSLLYWLQKAQEQEHLARSTDSLAQYRAILEESLIRDLALTSSLKSYISVEPDLTQEQFANFSRDLLTQHNHIRNMGAARDFIITHMYPLEGNEKAVGLDFRNLPEQMPMVQRAVDERTTVLVGPISLVQGGRGLIARQPIFRTDTGGLWGLVSVVIDVSRLFQTLEGQIDGAEFAIRGRDGRGAEGGMILGDPELFSSSTAVRGTIHLPAGSWQVAAKADYRVGERIVPIAVFAGFAVFFVLTIQLIRRQAAYEQELLDAKQAAEAANEEKSKFLAHMSHEIRTPMNGVVGVIQLLDQTQTEVERKELLEIARASAQNLMAVISDILDFSKIEAQLLELEQRPFSLDNLMEYVGSNIKSSAENKGLVFEFVRAEDVPAYWLGDEVRIGQILLNIASNAVKFTSEGVVRIEVSCEAGVETTQLQFEVSDQGIGMTQAEISQLFQPFTQADASISRRFGGTGLGLVIVKSLVDLMGGKIQVFSKKGEGTLFRVQLPLAPADAPETDTKQAKPNDSNLPDLTGVTVLHAEDIDINSVIFNRMMAPTRCRVVRANNGMEAVSKFAELRPDLVFMDIQMPMMDGITATQLIREQDPTVPIFALTANVTQDDVTKYLASGFTGVLAKPTRLPELRKLLAEHAAGVHPVA